MPKGVDPLPEMGSHFHRVRPQVGISLRKAWNGMTREKCERSNMASEHWPSTRATAIAD